MKFSLITIHEEKNGLVSGNWVQNHIGTLETASAAARATEAANSNRIRVAIIEELNSVVPMLSYWSGYVRLDVPGNVLAQPLTQEGADRWNDCWDREAKANS